MPRRPAISADRASPPKDVRSNKLSLLWVLPGPSHHDPRRYALQILNVILGGNASSRLFQELARKAGALLFRQRASLGFQ